MPSEAAAADIVLHSDVFVLTSMGPQDTVEILKSWALVLETWATSTCHLLLTVSQSLISFHYLIESNQSLVRFD